MSRLNIPTDGNRPDWFRLAANVVNSLLNRTSALETATDWSALADYADDTAAAAGGIAVGELYRTGSAVKVRVT